MLPRPDARVIALVTAICFAAAADAEMPDRVKSLLQARLPFTTGEFASIEQGHAVAKLLPGGDRREMAAGGAVRVAVPVQFFLQRFVDIVAFKQSPIVRQIGKFSATPRLEDLAGLTFDRGDLDELRSCRVGDCDIQLSAAQIGRIQAAVDWSRSDARVQANRVLREVLLEYVERYGRGGNGSLLEYANDTPPLRVSDELRLLVANSSQVLAGVPEFGELLLGSSVNTRPAEEFLYWSKEQFGLKPVVSITHVIIYQARRAEVPDVVIASKQIYASRYLAASLAITLGIDASPATGAPSFYLTYVNRTRLRAVPPIIGAIVRRVAQGRTRDGLEEQLQLAKSRLERAYRSSSK